MTKNHQYVIYITDLPDGTPINGQTPRRVKDLNEIFDKYPKARITVIWPNVKNNNTTKKTTRRSS